jgi:hypothetical protein
LQNQPVKDGRPTVVPVTTVIRAAGFDAVEHDSPDRCAKVVQLTCGVLQRSLVRNTGARYKNRRICHRSQKRRISYEIERRGVENDRFILFS